MTMVSGKFTSGQLEFKLSFKDTEPNAIFLTWPDNSVLILRFSDEEIARLSTWTAMLGYKHG